MQIHTTRFGTIPAAVETQYRIPEGFVGFRDQTRFQLIVDPACPQVHWFQSETLPDLAFGLINPSLIVPEYRVELRPGDRDALELVDGQSPRILVILNNVEECGLTVNLQGPIVLNDTKRLARQLVLTSSRHAVRYPIFGADPMVASVAPSNLETVSSVSLSLSA